MIKKYSPAFIIALLCFISSFGQTLSAGDIAFLQYNADGTNTTVKFLALVDIPVGESIFFTDNGWRNTNVFRTGEGTYTWTSPGITCGTIVSFTETNFSLSTEGDQLIAYQGTATTPTFITAIQMNGDWDGDSTNPNTSAIPLGLTDSADCLSITPETDNAIYSGILSGTVAQIRAEINNSANWTKSNTTPQTFTDTFTLSDCGVICTPTHSITSFSPSTGPANTQITITGSGFTGLSTVTIGGQTATIVSQSATELTVLLPNNAASGIITITESGCDTTAVANFTIITSNFNGCDGVVTPNELFISQITDATSGSLTYIELYNGTGGDLDLNDYTIQIRYNAGGFATTIPLSGTIVNGATYVASTTTIDPPCSNTIIGADGSLSNQTSSLSGINAGNNNSDCVSLYKNFTSNASPGTLIDVWGDCNDNNWMSTLGIGDEGFNFSRLTNASPPSITFNVADWNIVDWEDNACTDDDY